MAKANPGGPVPNPDWYLEYCSKTGSWVRSPDKVCTRHLPLIALCKICYLPLKKKQTPEKIMDIVILYIMANSFNVSYSMAGKLFWTMYIKTLSSWLQTYEQVTWSTDTCYPYNYMYTYDIQVHGWTHCKCDCPCKRDNFGPYISRKCYINPWQLKYSPCYTPYTKICDDA